jgi:hypothetical protein
VLPVEDPITAYGALFGGGTGHPPELQRKMIDTATADLEALRGKLPAHEHVKIEAQVQALARVARELAPVQAGAMSAPRCAAADRAKPAGVLDVEKRLKLHIELIIASFLCDVRRVATLMVTPGGHDSMGCCFEFLGIPVQKDLHNTIAHYVHSNPEAREVMAKIKTWEMDLFAHLIKRLKETPDIDGKSSLFQNTTLLFTSECKDGGHGPNPIPVVVATGSGKLKTGALLEASPASNYCDLLISLARASGAHLSSFGTNGKGPFAALEP